MVDDEPAIVLNVVWKAGNNLQPDWPVIHGYRMEVDGDPIVHTRVTFSPSGMKMDDPGAGTQVADLTNVITALPVINAIPAVCKAAPGIRTYADLPLITGRYVRPAQRRS